jgi:hypothetical protein
MDNPMDPGGVKPRANSRLTNILVFLLLAISLLTADFLQFESMFIGPHHNEQTKAIFARDYIDVPPLLLRINQCKTFVQTRSYWHEDYTPSVPFYRPLSLTWFWLESHAFGQDHFNRWVAVSIIINLVFCTLLWSLVKSTTKSTAIATVTLLVFAGVRNFTPLNSILFSYLTLPDTPSLTTSLYWKDQATLLSDSFTLAAIVLANKKSWIPGLFCALCSVLFKESGWITYAMVFVFLAGTGKIRDIPRWVYVATVVCIALPMIARAASGMGLIGGQEVGENRNWFNRYALATLGPCFLCFARNVWAAPLFATALYGIARLKKMTVVIRLVLCLAALAICGLLYGSEIGVDPVTGLVALLDPSMQLSRVLICLLFVIAAGWLFEEKDIGRQALVFLILSFIAAMPFAAAAQVLERALHMCHAFHSVVIALAWIAGYRVMGRTWTRLRDASKKAAPPPTEVVATWTEMNS